MYDKRKILYYYDCANCTKIQIKGCEFLYTLYNGDCLEEMDKLINQGVVVDMILTDPPYGTTACKWDSVIQFEPMWERINNLIKPNGCIALFGSEPFASFLRCSNIKNYKYDWIWEKDNSSNFMLLKKQCGKIHENISIFYKNQPIYNPQMRVGKPSHGVGMQIGKIQGKREYIGIKNFEIREASDTDKKYPVSIIKFNACGRGKAVHPTQKPVDLLEYLIKTYTNDGETILDFTMGSGSTGVACINTNRNFIGIELDHKYYNIAKSRLEEAEKNDK